MTGFPFANDSSGLHIFYLFHGKNGMEGDDCFILSNTVAGGDEVCPCLGRAKVGYSIWHAGSNLPAQNISNLSNPTLETEEGSAALH